MTTPRIKDAPNQRAIQSLTDTTRIRELEDELRAIRQGIPRLGELIELSDDGTIGRLRVWNQYGVHTETVTEVKPAPSATYTNPTQAVSRLITTPGVDSEIITAQMVAAAWGAQAVDYTRPTVRTETPTADSVIVTPGEICLVISVPPINVAIPGVMTLSKSTTPLLDLSTQLGLGGTAAGQVVSGSVRISTQPRIDGVIEDGGTPTYLTMFDGGMTVAANGQGGILPIVDNDHMSTDDEGRDFMVVSQVSGNQWARLNPFGGDDPVNGIQLATSLLHIPAITHFNYASIDSNGNIGSFRGTPVVVPEASSAASIPANAFGTNGITLRLTTVSPADTVLIGDNVQNKGNITLVRSDFPVDIRVVSPVGDRTYTFSIQE